MHNSNNSSNNDFRKEILKVNKQRNHKVKKSLGLKDAYKFLKKENIVNISQKEFSQIIKTVNKYLAEDFSNYHDIIFPYNMGKLEFRQYDTKVEYNNGKIETNRPIDWNKTLQLWEEDNNAKQNKILVRFESDQLYKIYYNKKESDFENQVYYQFKKNRKLNI